MKFQAKRKAVVDVCRMLADKGFLAGTGGNVALRADDVHFAVTPSATDYYAMSPVDICVVRLSDAEQVAGDQRPSVESGLHARVLRARLDCNVSIHSHQPIASAYTLFGKPLSFHLPEHRELLGDTVPCTGYAPSGTSWLARKVARCIRPDVHAYLMRNHGVVCVGVDLAVALQRVAALERACALFFEQQLAGQKATMRPELMGAVRDALAPHIVGEASEAVS